MEGFYVIINFGIPIVLLFFVAKYLFFSENYKRIKLVGTLFQKIFQFTVRLIAVVLTTIISWIVLVFIGLSTGVYSMSTYGTPIHRPRIK